MDLKRILRTIDLLDKCLASNFVDIREIEKNVNESGSKYVKNKWKEIEGYVSKFCLPSLKYWSKVPSILTAITFIWVIFAFGSSFNITFIPEFIINSAFFFLSFLFVITIGFSLYSKNIAKQKFEKVYDEFSEEKIKVRKTIQGFIIYLSRKINNVKEDINNYQVELNYGDYIGIQVKKKLGKNRFLVVPSMLGTIVSSAKNYIKIIDPWADLVLLSFIAKVSPKIPVKLIMSRKKFTGKRITSACLWLKRKKNFEVHVDEVDNFDDKDHRYVITETNMWKSDSKRKDRNWSVYNRDYGKRRRFEKFFDKWWGNIEVPFAMHEKVKESTDTEKQSLWGRLISKIKSLRS